MSLRKERFSLNTTLYYLRSSFTEGKLKILIRLELIVGGLQCLWGETTAAAEFLLDGISLPSVCLLKVSR